MKTLLMVIGPRLLHGVLLPSKVVAVVVVVVVYDVVAMWSFVYLLLLLSQLNNLFLSIWTLIVVQRENASSDTVIRAPFFTLDFHLQQHKFGAVASADVVHTPSLLPGSNSNRKGQPFINTVRPDS